MSTTWEPGEPLAEPGTWVRPMFEVLPNDPRREPGPDAARWPEPWPWQEVGDA